MNHDQLTRGLCDACGKTIRKGATRLGCATSLCSNQCHSGEKCSGINRYRAQPWHCHLHSTATASGPAQPVTCRSGPEMNSQSASQTTQTQDVSPHPSVHIQTQTQDICPPTSVTQPQDPTRDKRKCSLCHRPIRSDTLPALCSTCNRPFHKKCTALQRVDADAVAEGLTQWSCPTCSQQQPKDFIKSIGGTLIETSAQNNTKTLRDSLRILQWNADGLTPKVSELELHLKRGNYDICAIQETKLRKGRATPRVPGYTSIRLDRPNNNGGGGLLTYVRDSLVFERVGESFSSGTETSTIRVRTSRKKWVVISNVYCPPSRSHTSQTELRLDHIPTSDNILVLGDFNAHSDVWDGFQPQDSRGDVLFGWACERDLAIMNDGSHTRSNRSSPLPTLLPNPPPPFQPLNHPPPRTLQQVPPQRAKAPLTYLSADAPGRTNTHGRQPRPLEVQTTSLSQ